MNIETVAAQAVQEFEEIKRKERLNALAKGIQEACDQIQEDRNQGIPITKLTVYTAEGAKLLLLAMRSLGHEAENYYEVTGFNIPGHSQPTCYTLLVKGDI